jgi:hypothetical protein
MGFVTIETIHMQKNSKNIDMCKILMEFLESKIFGLWIATKLQDDVT